MSIPAAMLKLLSKWIVMFGIAQGICGELSWLNLIVPKTLFLVPLTRFPGFVWSIVAGFALPSTIEEDGLAQTGVTRRYVSRGTTEICVRSPDTSSRSGPLIQVAAPESFGTSLCRESTSRGSLERARPPSNAQSLPSRASPRSFFRRLRSDALKSAA